MRSVDDPPPWADIASAPPAGHVEPFASSRNGTVGESLSLGAACASGRTFALNVYWYGVDAFTGWLSSVTLRLTVAGSPGHAATGMDDAAGAGEAAACGEGVMGARARGEGHGAW